MLSFEVITFELLDQSYTTVGWIILPVLAMDHQWRSWS